MGKLLVKLARNCDKYRITIGKKNIIHTRMCVKEFENIVKIIGAGRNFDSKIARIDSIKFVGLKKADENTKANFFLTKDKKWWLIWNKNPSKQWFESHLCFEKTGYTTDAIEGTIVIDFYLKTFEAITGLRKQAILKIGDIYGFKRIDMRVSDIRIV